MNKKEPAIRISQLKLT